MTSEQLHQRAMAGAFAREDKPDPWRDSPQDVLRECMAFVEAVRDDERTIEAGLWRGDWLPRLLKRIWGVLRE
jgi:hypothetical protein